MKTLIAVLFLAATATTALADPPACTTAPRSCDNWSDYYDVGAPYCGKSKVCDGEIEPYLVPVTYQKQEHFRICEYKDGTECMETQQTVKYLGCYCDY